MVFHCLRECSTYAIYDPVYLGSLGRSDKSLCSLLASEKVVLPLSGLVGATGRFRRVFAAFADVP